MINGLTISGSVVLINLWENDVYTITLFIIALTSMITTVFGLLALFFGWKNVRESKQRIKVKLETTFIFKEITELEQLKHETIYKLVLEFYNYLLTEVTGTISGRPIAFISIGSKRNWDLRKDLLKTIDYIDSFLIKYDHFKTVLDKPSEFNALIKLLKKMGVKFKVNNDFYLFRKEFFSDTIILSNSIRKILNKRFEWKFKQIKLKKI